MEFDKIKVRYGYSAPETTEWQKSFLTWGQRPR